MIRLFGCIRSTLCREPAAARTVALSDDMSTPDQESKANESINSNGMPLIEEERSSSLTATKRMQVETRVIASALQALRAILPKVGKYLYKAGLVMVDIAGTGLYIGSVVKTLGDSYTGGCFSHKDICTYMDLIKEIEPRCIEKVEKVEELYGKYRKDYSLLQDIAEKNVYINEKLKRFTDLFISIKGKSENVRIAQDQLLNISELGKLPDANISYLLNIPVNKSLKELESFQENAGVFEVDLFKTITFKVAAIVAKASFAHFDQKLNDLGCAGCISFMNPKSIYTHRQKIFQALKQTKEDLTNFFRKKYFLKNMKALALEKWESFKGKVKNPRGTVQKYIKGLSVASAIGTLASSAITIYSLIQQDNAWKEVEQNVKSTYENLTAKEREIDEALLEGQGYLEPVSNYTQQAINDYVEFVETFDSEIGAVLAEAAGSQQVLTPQETVTSENAIDNQEDTLRKLNAMEKVLAIFLSWVTALEVLNEHAKRKINAKTPLNEAYRELKDNWIYFSDDIQPFSHLIRLENYVCTISTLQLTEDFYTNYDLKSIRGQCVTSANYTFTDQYKIDHRDLTINFYIGHHINSARSLFHLEKLLGQELKNDPIIQDRRGIDELVILCKIAALFPDMQEWENFQLQDFRIPNCELMSDDDFFDLLDKAY